MYISKLPNLSRFDCIVYQEDTLRTPARGTPSPLTQGGIHKPLYRGIVSHSHKGSPRGIVSNLINPSPTPTPLTTVSRGILELRILLVHLDQGCIQHPSKEGTILLLLQVNIIIKGTVHVIYIEHYDIFLICKVRWRVVIMSRVSFQIRELLIKMRLS